MIKSIDKLLTLAAHMAVEIPDHMPKAAAIARGVEDHASLLAAALVEAMSASLEAGKPLSPATFKMVERVLGK
jgi:hypothetical protein